MQGIALESFGPSSPSASSCMGSPRIRRSPKEAPDPSTQDACSPCSARAAAHKASRQPLVCMTDEGKQHRDTASQAQLLPASQAGAEADCPSSTRKACQENPKLSSSGTADPAERSCMQSGSAAVRVQLDASAAVSAEHMQENNSHSADHQAAAARLHDGCVLAEQPVNKQNTMPSDLALAGKAKGHKLAKLGTQSEQHGRLVSMQPENRLNKSLGSQSQAQPVSDNAKQSEQLPQQQQSSMQAHQAFSAQPGRTGRQERPVSRTQARAPLLVRLGLFPGCFLVISSLISARIERLV